MITQERIKAFEKFLIEQERSRATVEKYVRDVRAFVTFADEREIDKALVLAYKGYLQERYATASVNSVLSSLGAFFGYCERLDLCVKRVKVFPHNLRHLFARTFTPYTRTSCVLLTYWDTPALTPRASIPWSAARYTAAASTA